MLACRLCRVDLSAPTGCDVCEPVRRNLVVVGEAEEDRPSLSGVGAEIVRMLRDEMSEIRELQRKDKAKAQPRLLAAANTVAKVIGEVRKLQDDGKKAIEAMSFAERAQLFIEWYAALPPAYRMNVQEQQAEHEARIRAPIETEQKALS